MTVTPELRRTAVFRSGTEKASMGCTPGGGQAQPISGVGARLLWKNAQKNAKKNITSDAMNSSMPKRRPDLTCEVCIPITVASRVTSRHHWYMEAMVRITPIVSGITQEKWKDTTRPKARLKAPIEDTRGHGLISTRWNGCRGIGIFFRRNFLLGR